MNTVKEWFDWRSNSKEKSVEEHNKEKIGVLMWKYTDVLYSFLGIYTIGAWVYYSEKFNRTDCMIKRKGENKIAYNYGFLSRTFGDFEELNSLSELKKFIECYFSIGNVCPIWPGGNEHRGKSCCFDIPDIYFKRHKTWTEYLIKEYPNSFINDIANSNNVFCANGNIKFFLDNMEKEGKRIYIDFLKHIISVIEHREKQIGGYLKKLKK